MDIRTILMIPSWYPTKDNKFAGSFFREQALAMDGHYNFIVVHYTEHTTFALKAFFKNHSKKILAQVNSESNIIEYNVDYYSSFLQKISNVLYTFKIRHLKHKFENGVGSFLPDSYLRKRERFVKRVLDVNKWEFDYIYGLCAQDVAIPAMVFSNVSQKPYVLAEHGPFPWPGHTINNLQKRGLEQAQLFLAISNDKIRQVLLQNVHLKRIEYIGNLVDENTFVRAPIEHGTIKTFVIVAATSFYKQYSMFIKIFNELSIITDVPFKVVVAGYKANKNYSKNPELLEQQLKESKFADKLELIPTLERSEMPFLYNRTDVFVMTSIQEGQPVSAMEAACCGLPVFSTRCGGVEDYINSEEGRIYSITDYKSFAQGLKEYLEGKITFDNEHIRKKCVSYFGKEAFVGNFYKSFESL